MDLNSSVFDSPRLISSSAWRCARRYWSKRKFFTAVAEGRIVRDALVQLEVRVDDVLDGVLDLLVEGQAHVLPRVDPRAGVEPRVCVEPLHHLAEGQAMLRAEVEPEALVQLGDDPGERFQLLRLGPGVALGAHRVEQPGLPLQRDAAARRLLDPVGLHVDVLLDLARQLLAVRREQAPEVTREHVELLQIGVGERQHLDEEGVEPHVVGEVAAEVSLLRLGERPNALDDRREGLVELVLRGLAVEVDPGEAVDVGLGIDRKAGEPASGSRRAGSDRSPRTGASSRSRARTPP